MYYKLKIYSPNISVCPLRAILLNRRVVLRQGSSRIHNIPRNTLELNSSEGIIISSDKRKSKTAMDQASVHHAEWIHIINAAILKQFYKNHNVIIIKRYNSCKGNDIYYIDSFEALSNWIRAHRLELNKYIAEKYYTFNREYRFHIDRRHGIFYGCRKLLRRDAEDIWHRHDSNSIWILPENPKFKKPTFIKKIEEDCIKYMDLVGLDICAFDVKCNDSTFIILESNTAPSLGNHGIEVYKNHFQKYYNETI